MAVDGPTGLNYDTGALDPAAIPADVTVTFAYPKLGHFAFPGASACGQLVVADIGTDPKLAQDITLEVADAEMIRAMLPARPSDAHKGTFGKAMIVAGSIYYSGAAALAAQAATRVGAGLVTLCPPRAIYGVVASKLTEVTYLPLPDDLGVLRTDAVEVLAEKVEGYQALLVGPGLSTEKETVAFVRRLLSVEPPAKKARIGFQASASAPEPDKLALPAAGGGRRRAQRAGRGRRLGRASPAPVHPHAAPRRDGAADAAGGQIGNRHGSRGRGAADGSASGDTSSSSRARSPSSPILMGARSCCRLPIPRWRRRAVAMCWRVRLWDCWRKGSRRSRRRCAARIFMGWRGSLRGATLAMRALWQAIAGSACQPPSVSQADPRHSVVQAAASAQMRVRRSRCEVFSHVDMVATIREGTAWGNERALLSVTVSAWLG